MGAAAGSTRVRCGDTIAGYVMAGSVCVVTVHGIGFQQPPNGGTAGYADALHEHLRKSLGDRLGDDPNREGARGPVYVSSEWEGSPAKGWRGWTKVSRS